MDFMHRSFNHLASAQQLVYNAYINDLWKKLRIDAVETANQILLLNKSLLQQIDRNSY